MKRICAECGERPVVVSRYRTKRGQRRWKAMGKGHDLCDECWRAMRTRDVVARLKARERAREALWPA